MLVFITLKLYKNYSCVKICYDLTKYVVEYYQNESDMMAKGRFTGGRQIKKGQVLNPKGSRGLPADIKEMRQLSVIEYIATVNKLLYLTQKELEAILKNPATTMIEGMIGNIMLKAACFGDTQRANFILDRLIGKVPGDSPAINVSVSTNVPKINFGFDEPPPDVIDVESSASEPDE